MLVRMTLDERPLYVSNVELESIRPIVADEGQPRCWLQYLDGRERTVDGTPDEVFKALFNPPETLLKAEVADVLGRAHSSLSGMYGHGEVMAARRAMEAVAKALGLKVRE